VPLAYEGFRKKENPLEGAKKNIKTFENQKKKHKNIFYVLLSLNYYKFD